MNLRNFSWMKELHQQNANGGFTFTDLGSLIGNTQCRNFRNFLPLGFYVKSMLVILKPKNAMFTI